MTRRSTLLCLVLSSTACGSGSNTPSDAATSEDSGAHLSIENDQTLPDGRLHQAYSVQILVTGGTAPYAFTVGGEFAAGLGIDPHTGVFGGTPTTPGHGRLIVGVTDASRASTSKLFSIYIAPDPLVITSSAIPSAREGTRYLARLEATGGVPPLGWFLARSSTIPPGLRLSLAGTITGTPTAQGQFDITINVKDAETETATHTFPLTVLPP
jgi:hypothetical protein